MYDFEGERTAEKLSEFVEARGALMSHAGFAPVCAAQGGHESAESKSIPKKGKKVDAGPTDVVVVTDANFAEEFKKGPMLLELYAPVRVPRG